MSLSDTWGIIRQTLDGTGNGSLHFTYGAGINPWANDSILAMLPSGNIGINKAVPTEKLDVAGNIGVSGTVDGVDVAAHHVRHESGGDDPIPINALGITGTLDIVGQKTYLRGNASASLLHLSRITTTTWYGWDLSSIVGSRTAVVFIRVDNNTGSNHSYAIAPLSSDVWFPADFGWERGTASGQIDSADEGILIAYTNASGVVYLRAESNHDHATDYYLVGFI